MQLEASLLEDEGTRSAPVETGDDLDPGTLCRNLAHRFTPVKGYRPGKGTVPVTSGDQPLARINSSAAL